MTTPIERRAAEVADEIAGIPLGFTGSPQVKRISEIVLAFARAEVERELHRVLEAIRADVGPKTKGTIDRHIEARRRAQGEGT